MEGQPLIYMARHGSTALNGKADCFRGKMDIELDAEGRRDAHRLAHYFEPFEFGHIISSDRKRADETADIIARSKGMEVYSTPSLRAFNVGVFSGKPKNKENEEALQEYIQNPDRRVPEGESLNEFKNRIRPAIWEACEIAQEEGKPLLLVAHSSCIHELGDMFHGDHEAVLVEPGGVAVVCMTAHGITAAPIYKRRQAASVQRADTIS